MKSHLRRLGASGHSSGPSSGPPRRVRSVEVQVQLGGEERRRVVHGDLRLADLAGEVGELDRGRLLEPVEGDAAVGEAHLGGAGGAVLVHLAGGVLVVVREPLVGHATTLLATSGYSYRYRTVGSRAHLRHFSRPLPAVTTRTLRG